MRIIMRAWYACETYFYYLVKFVDEIENYLFLINALHCLMNGCVSATTPHKTTTLAA